MRRVAGTQKFKCPDVVHRAEQRSVRDGRAGSASSVLLSGRRARGASFGCARARTVPIVRPLPRPCGSRVPRTRSARSRSPALRRMREVCPERHRHSRLVRGGQALRHAPAHLSTPSHSICRPGCCRSLLPPPLEGVRLRSGVEDRRPQVVGASRSASAISSAPVLCEAESAIDRSWRRSGSMGEGMRSPP